MFVWMMVVLKIPIAALLWLVWWSSKAPEPQEEEPARVDARPVHGPGDPRPRRPRPPRRGPHAEPAPPAPSRVRARGRSLSRPKPLR
jgi:hypothetical protein